jgi:hypothetical protein
MGLNALGFIQLSTVASLTHIDAFKLSQNSNDMSEWSCAQGAGSITAIIRCASLKICDDTTLQQRLWNKWLPAETWVEALTIANLIDQTLLSSIRIVTLMLLWEGSEETLMAK